MTVRGCLLLLAAALLQVTVLGRLEPALAVPNVVLALCAARAFRHGGRAGMLWALAGGFLLDLGGAVGPLGMHALAMLAAAYAAGALGAHFDSRNPALAVLAGAAAGLVYGGVVLAAADTLRLAEIGLHQALPLLAAGAAVSGLATALAAGAFARWDRQPAVTPQW